MFFSVLCLLCLCACLFICGLWSPAGKLPTVKPVLSDKGLKDIW